MNRPLSAKGKKIIIGFIAVILIVLMFVFIKGCNKKNEPDNKENPSEITETADPSENENSDNKQESDSNDEGESESKILENEGEVEIILEEDEETFGE